MATNRPTPDERRRAFGISKRTQAAFAAHSERLKAQEAAPAENEVQMYGEIADDMYAGWYFEDEAVVFPSKIRARLAEIEGDVVVRMNSPGGDVFAGAAIGAALDDVRRDGRKVTVRVDGLAASAASYVAIRGDDVAVDEAGQVMVHRPWTSLLGGDETDFAKVAEQLRTTKKSLISTYTKRNRKGLDAEAITEMVDEETWMDAETAVEKGFADRVMEPPQPVEDRGKKRKKDAIDEDGATMKACAEVHANIQRSIWKRLSQEG